MMLPTRTIQEAVDLALREEERVLYFVSAGGLTSEGLSDPCRYMLHAHDGATTPALQCGDFGNKREPDDVA